MGVTALLGRFIAFNKNQEMRSDWSTAWGKCLSVNNDRFHYWRIIFIAFLAAVKSQ